MDALSLSVVSDNRRIMLRFICSTPPAQEVHHTQESSLSTHPYSGFPSQTSSNSPDSSISLKISNPPRSSPFRMICGNAICQSRPHRLFSPLTRPIINLLQTLPDLLIAEDIEPSKLNSLFPQQTHSLSREPTFGRGGVSFHKQDNLVLVHQLVTSGI